jgi:hypothetical protein
MAVDRFRAGNSKPLHFLPLDDLAISGLAKHPGRDSFRPVGLDGGPDALLQWREFRRNGRRRSYKEGLGRFWDYGDHRHSQNEYFQKPPIFEFLASQIEREVKGPIPSTPIILRHSLGTIRKHASTAYSPSANNHLIPVENLGC